VRVCETRGVFLTGMAEIVVFDGITGWGGWGDGTENKDLQDVQDNTNTCWGREWDKDCQDIQDNMNISCPS